MKPCFAPPGWVSRSPDRAKPYQHTRIESALLPLGSGVFFPLSAAGEIGVESFAPYKGEWDNRMAVSRCALVPIPSFPDLLTFGQAGRPL